MSDEIFGTRPEIIAADRIISGYREFDLQLIDGRKLISLGNANSNRLLASRRTATSSARPQSLPAREAA